ncbi:MAG: hypothetical protein AB7V08_09585 [Elusimicrobiales bacterium]
MPNDLSKIRVYVKKEHYGIYQSLNGKVFSQYHTLFALAVFIGYKTKKPQPFPAANKKELFWSNTFSQDELNGFYALFVLENEKGNRVLLENKEEAVKWLQEYANAGMEELVKSSCLKKYIGKAGGDYTIEFSSKDYLQKQVLFEIFSKYSAAEKV